MNTGTDNIKELLHRFNLNKPIPAEVKSHFAARMGPLFKRVAKEAGIYTILFGFVSNLYFLIKRIGIVISVKTIITLLTIFSLTGVGAIAYFLLSKPVVEIIEPVKEEQTPSIKKVTTAGESSPTVSYTLAIEQISSSSVDRRALQNATSTIADELTKLRGNSYSALSTKAGSTTYTMTGYVEQVENTLFLFVKVVDNRNSAIVLVTREKVDVNNNLLDACKRISTRIADTVR